LLANVPTVSHPGHLDRKSPSYGFGAASATFPNLTLRVLLLEDERLEGLSIGFLLRLFFSQDLCPAY
jgi:hypothetical protein